MNNLIEQSASSTTFVPRPKVEWITWKDVFNGMFSVPRTFKLSKYHVFAFSKFNMGQVHANFYTKCATVESFSMIPKKLLSVKL